MHIKHDAKSDTSRIYAEGRREALTAYPNSLHGRSLDEARRNREAGIARAQNLGDGYDQSRLLSFARHKAATRAKIRNENIAHWAGFACKAILNIGLAAVTCMIVVGWIAERGINAGRKQACEVENHCTPRTNMEIRTK